MRHRTKHLTLIATLLIAASSIIAAPTTAQQTTAQQPLNEPTVGPTATPPQCTNEQGFISLSTSAKTLEVGEAITLTATVQNEGACANPYFPQFWWPKYSIWGGETDDPAILSPLPQEPIYTNQPLYPGQEQTVSFVLQAASPGVVSLQAHVSYANHLDYPGPSYWTSNISDPITVTVRSQEQETAPSATYLPLLHQGQACAGRLGC